MPEANPEREQRILDASAGLFAHYGFDKTTVDEIAREAGISKGAVYLHFRSKEDLFEALVLRESERVTVRFFELIDADPRGVTLFNIYRYGMEILLDSPLLAAIYTRDRRVLGDYVRRLRDTPAFAQAMSFSVEFVRFCQDAGMIRRDLDAETVTYLLGALRYGVLTMEDFTPKGQRPPGISQLGETLAELITNGLAPREEESDPSGARQALERQALERLLVARLQLEEQRRKG